MTSKNIKTQPVRKSSTSRPTINDVANAAGVSKATVSRVLNGTSAYIRPATAEHVKQVVAQLGFRPNGLARSLSLQRSGTLALVVSDIVNPFYAEVIHGLEDAALEQDSSVFLCNTNYDLKRGLKLIHSLVDKRVDGVLLMSSSMEKDWLDELLRHGVPVVVVDPASKRAQQGIGTIKVDFATGIREAVTAFIEAGHRRLAFVSGPLGLQTARVRREAFYAAVLEHGIDPASVVEVESNFRMDGGRAAFKHLGGATAIFCSNDLLALGVLAEARKQGLDLPRDLSIIGLDDIEMAADSFPALSTVALPRYEVGRLAAELIFELMAKTTPAQPERVVRTTYIPRESVATVMTRREDGR